MVSKFESRQSGSLLLTVCCTEEETGAHKTEGSCSGSSSESAVGLALGPAGPQPCLLVGPWGGRVAVASPPAAAQELPVLLAESVQPIREVFKIEDVPVESFKISLD